MDSKKSLEWLGLDEEDEQEVVLEKRGKKTRAMLELEKTYKGDSRFRLDSKFSNDIEYNLLPNNVRLSLSSKEQKEAKKDDFEAKEMHSGSEEEEANRTQKILDQVFLEKSLNPSTFNLKPHKPHSQKYQIVKRYDPNMTNSVLPVKSSKIHEKIEKRSMQIEKGIDKKKLRIQKANKIIQNALKKDEEEIKGRGSGQKEIPKPAAKSIKINFELLKSLDQK